MKQWAVLKDVDGKSGKNSMTSWAGEAFKVYENSSEALKNCLEINKFYKANNLPYVAYVASGVFDETGFHKDAE